MFDTLTTANIISNATLWTSEFDPMTLTAVGLGIGFACVSFVKRLFF